ncbi:uncharacterized protein LOC143912066 [Arctopsyche grandis]|uniref:uncharacterized protein LOC143912066 n=1 Tax=Arctopsyche grandis TaxID=121162 RepID=UPI00406D9F1B
MESSKQTVAKNEAFKNWSETVFVNGIQSRKHFIEAMKGMAIDVEYMKNVKIISDELMLKARQQAVQVPLEPKVQPTIAEVISEEKAQIDKNSNLLNKIKVRREAVEEMRRQVGN